jgi:hypothetical protein
LGLKAGDFSAWTAGLYKKDIERNHLTLFNMAELVLFKNLDSDISDKFNKQATIIGNLIGKLPSDVEKFMSDNYSTKKYYIKYFD